MTFNQIKMAIYATLLTNIFGLKLKSTTSSEGKKALRYQYSKTLLEKLNISINVEYEDKLPKDGQFLLLSNHRSVTDPTIIEIVLEKTKIFGHWISKKELYNSFFFGQFVRNAGTILLNREATHANNFMKDIKQAVAKGDSIFMFPEGTRSKSNDEITAFKDGARLIALRNRLPILPLYIETQSNDVLMAALKDPSKHYEITVVIGDVIAYKDRSVDIEDAYRAMFGLKPEPGQN